MPNFLFPMDTWPTLLLGLLTSCFLIDAVHKLYFHPLSRFPGPLLWKVSRIPFALSSVKGQYVHRIRDFHIRYGEIVRVAPDELSFANPSAWYDIHQRQQRYLPFLKNPIFMSKPQSHPVDSIITTTNVADHARMLKALGGSFNFDAILHQEPIVQENIQMMIDKLTSLIREEEEEEPNTSGLVIDLTEWYSFCMFDTMGELAFGESFGCLEKGKYHKWARICTHSMKLHAIDTAFKYFPRFNKLLKAMLPTYLKEQERYHYHHTVEKVNKRMGSDRQRHDFMTPVMSGGNIKASLSLEEIYCNFEFLVIAGSETTTITLSGITHYLAKNNDVLHKLELETRNEFDGMKNITAQSLNGLPYLAAVVKEGLRLCNSVPAGNSRITPKGGAYICGEFIPEGTQVGVHTYTLNLSQDHFTNPFTFYPERWLEPPNPYSSGSINHNTAATHPFGLGTKRCLGQELAWLELKLIVAKMVLSFDIIYDARYDFDWQELKIYFGVETHPVMVRLRTRGT